MARNLALEKCYVVKYRFAFIDKKETWRFMDVWMKCLNALDDFLDDIGDSFLALDFSISDQAPRLSLGCSICRYMYCFLLS